MQHNENLQQAYPARRANWQRWKVGDFYRKYRLLQILRASAYICTMSSLYLSLFLR